MTRDEYTALHLVADIRAALGDNGKRMQSELIEYCAHLHSDSKKLQRIRAARTKMRQPERALIDTIIKSDT